MDGFLANLIKYLLFITNFLVFLMGLVVCGFGVFALVDGEALSSLVESADQDVTINVYTTAAILLIVVSIFVILVTFFGCCGAIKESRCMLGIYFTVLLSMFIVMIVGAVIGYSQPLKEIKEPLKKSMEKYDPDSTEKEMKRVTDSWDKVQEDLKCCGVDEITDWETNKYLIDNNFKVPVSCCKHVEGEEVECQKNPGQTKPELKACYDKLKTSIEDNSANILIVAVIIVIVMFLNMIFAFAMCTMAK